MKAPNPTSAATTETGHTLLAWMLVAGWIALLGTFFYSFIRNGLPQFLG